MDIPKTLKIGGHQVKVSYPYLFTERNDIFGQCSHDECEIRVSGECEGKERPASSVAVTFLHEILHFIDYNTGWRMFVGEDGEAKLEAITEGLYQVLVDNDLHFRGGDA